MSPTVSALPIAAITLAPAGGSAQARGLAPITDAQSAKIDTVLQLDSRDKALSEAVSQAAGTIAPFLKAHSCMTGFDAGSLNIHAVPGKSYPSNNCSKAPLQTMYMHPKSACATVVRIQGWKMPSPNALRFEVVYASALSGESKKGQHALKKRPGREWLVSN